MVGVPAWFVGGLLGLAVTIFILAFASKFMKARGVAISVLVIGMSVMNWQIFYWPLWAAIVTGIGFVWSVNR